MVHTLQLLHPKRDAQLQLAKKVALIGPLTELVAHEHDAGAAFLTPEYRVILQQATQLQQQSSRQPAHLERLYGTEPREPASWRGTGWMHRRLWG